MGIGEVGGYDKALLCYGFFMTGWLRGTHHGRTHVWMTMAMADGWRMVFLVGINKAERV